MRRLLAGTVTLATLIACSGGGGSSTADNPIIDGKVDTDANDAVVMVVSPSDTAGYVTRCTGTVVAPNMVLTARHCVSRTDPTSLCNADGTATTGGRVLADRKASDIQIYTGVDAAADTARAVGKAVPGVADTQARGKKLVVEDTKTYCSHDVAFIVLDRNLDVPVAPVRLASGPVAGELLTAIGWGLNEDGELATERMVRTGIPIKTVGPAVLSTGGIGISDSEFQVGESFCQGDSGGPSLSASGAVVGVVSRGGNGTSGGDNAAAGCMGPRTVNTYTHLANKLDLVTRAFTAAGHRPVLETPITDAGAEAGLDGSADAAPAAPVVVVEDAPDAAISVAPQRLATSSASGCAAAPGTSGKGWALALVALAFARRRRR